MNPLLVVATFELRYHLRQPTSLLFVALIFGQGVWYAYQPDNLFLAQGSAIQVYTILSSLGIALAIAAILLAGQSLTKDSAYKTTAYLYTLPISSRTHFSGRFLGTLSLALLLAIFYPIGILFTLAINATLDPFSLIALADGLVWLVIPNVFIYVSVAFASTVFLRGIWGAYSCLFLSVLYFLLTNYQPGTGAYADIWQLLDPFAVGMIRESIDKMAFLPDSDGLLSFSDILIISRLFWIGLALGALAQAEARFSFDTFVPKTTNQKWVAERSVPTTYTRQRLQAIRLQFDGWAPLRTTFRVAQLESHALIRQPIFQLTVGLLILLTLLLATVFNLNPDFPELPVTSRMTALREPMGLFIGLFLLVITGELIFQERTIGFWPIFDALPQPDAVLLTGKLLALIGIAALLTVILFLTGVGLQVSNGFSDIDWVLYRNDLLMDGFFRYCQLIILGACVAVLINNRLLSHITNLLIFSLLTITYQLNSPDQQRWLYSFLPGSTAYSDLIGYGTQAPVRLAIHSIWWGVSGLLLCLFLLTWNRGVPGSLRARMDQFRYKWSRQYALLILGSFLIMGMGLGKLIQHIAATPTFTGQYKTKTASFQSLSGKPIAVTVRYQHPYQVPHMLLATKAALRKGETLFGAYPYSRIQVCEVPTTQNGILSTPGNILISEKQGWIADDRQPNKLDHIDYLISREVFKQWLVHRLRPAHKPGDGFVRQSLAEYLALQMVAEQYGYERLKERLTQRTNLYVSGRNRSREPEVPALQSSGNDAVERGRAALTLTSIGQVWGDAPLSLTISQFYQKALTKPTEATADAFSQQLTSQLPDSLNYLTTYLSKPLWFDFKLGRIANLPNGLAVEIIPAKWQEDIPGVRHPLMSNDFIPLAILDQNGREIYHQLVRPNSGQPFVSLPAFPNAKAILIDPLGTWPEWKKYDNYKLL